MKKLVFPQKPSAGVVDFGNLSHVLFESADLLESARESSDSEFKAQAVELAIRALYAGSAALDRHFGNRKPSVGSVVKGPWAAPTT